MVSDSDVQYLRRSIELAAAALAAGDEPFGSLLVAADGEVLFEDRNRVASGDPTRHPEFEIARWAARNMTPQARAAATVYTSGEHCPMCAAAHGWVGLGRIVYVSSSRQLATWLADLGVAPAAVAPLPIREIVPGLAVDGPVPELAGQVHDLHRRFREKRIEAADGTAVRVALWRAMHVEVDSPPHVLVDQIGLALAAPDDDWRSRPDMHPEGTSLFRASIVARARFVEDLVAEKAAEGVAQYVILGAGLDTFAQRRPEAASGLHVFEVDRPGPQAWKRQRLSALGFGVPAWLRFVPVDFEAGDAWWEQLAAAGFDAGRPAVVASTGVSMYLRREAIAATLRQVASLAPGTTLAMTFLLPLELMAPEVRPGFQMAAKGAQAGGTPFLSFFTPEEMLALAREAGFREARHVSAAMLAARYFSGRADGLRPPGNSEELLVATT